MGLSQEIIDVIVGESKELISLDNGKMTANLVNKFHSWCEQFIIDRRMWLPASKPMRKALYSLDTDNKNRLSKRNAPHEIRELARGTAWKLSLVISKFNTLSCKNPEGLNTSMF